MDFSKGLSLCGQGMSASFTAKHSTSPFSVAIAARRGQMRPFHTPSTCASGERLPSIASLRVPSACTIKLGPPWALDTAAALAAAAFAAAAAASSGGGKTEPLAEGSPFAAAAAA